MPLAPGTTLAPSRIQLANTSDAGFTVSLRPPTELPRRMLLDDIVNVDQSHEIEFPAAAYPSLSVIVDNDGNPHTDWLVLSIH